MPEAESYLAGGQSGGEAASTGGDRCTLHVHTNLDTLPADGTTLDVGRRTRSIPPALRRALERRDGGCRFPGCTAHHYFDAHHIHHWADGG